jgi:hypothetical protein
VISLQFSSFKNGSCGKVNLSGYENRMKLITLQIIKIYHPRLKDEIEMIEKATVSRRLPCVGNNIKIDMKEIGHKGTMQQSNK